MDPSTVLTLVQTFLQVLDSSIYSDVESVLCYKSHLNELKATMRTIQEVLVNAEKMQMLQLPISISQFTLERLQEAVYEADNLFDEVATVVQRKKLMDGNSVTKELRLFFSRFNQILYAFNKSCEIGAVRRVLDDIAKDHRDFGSMSTMQTVHFEVRKSNPRETHSFVCEEDVIIGRDDDKRIVIDMLRDTSVEEEAISVISIVGIGGLGKTTLAKLVYNDEAIVGDFPLRMWVCVSEDFKVKVLLGQLLEAATREPVDSSLSMEQLQRKLREKLDGKKFLLVLDDVWNEDPRKWQELRKMWTQGGKGSRVIVTTRSKKVASVVGSHHTRELKGLTDDESWSLFQRMAGQVQLEGRFIEIGKEIVRKCANVPLAIRVAGSLVNGNLEESRWLYLKNIDLAHMNTEEGGILPVLKVSYRYLPTHLKSCFTYCAIYPKDYRIKKEELIELWMAQGFILPLDDEQSFEVLGEEYFMSLLQRCFFQDIERDDDGGISSCKMHDLIHDLAIEVAGSGIKSSDDQLNSLGHKTHHFSLRGRVDDKCYLSKMKSLRTFLNIGGQTRRKRHLFKMKYLRVLDLQAKKKRSINMDEYSNFNMDEYSNLSSTLKNIFSKARVLWMNIPSMIGELLHLRYLNFSENEYLHHLPDTITQLYNLKTLKLRSCESLKELPKNLSKLVNLRHLDIAGCISLTHMPPRMNTLTSLHKLTRFVIGKTYSVSSSMPIVGNNFGRLGDIKYLNHLKGLMEIKIPRGWTSEVRQGRYLINKPNLREVKIIWDWDFEEGNDAEAWLEGLQPHSNLTKFELTSYPGASFPNWVESSMNLNTCLPNLVQLQLYDCGELLDHLPLVSQLRHLKVLRIDSLSKLEYMESGSRSSDDRATTHQSGGSTREDELVFFPSLEELVLDSMGELKGWWKTPSHSDLKQTFPRLSKLEITSCRKLISFPFCPKLKSLKLFHFNREIGPIIMREEAVMEDGMNNNGDSPASTSTSTLNNNNNNNRIITQSQAGLLREVDVDDVGFLNCQPKEAFHHLSSLRIWSDSKIERVTTGEVGELFQSGCLSSLRQLEFERCSKLKSISGRGVWEHFTALEELRLWQLEEMEMEEEEEKDVNNGGNEVDVVVCYVPWKCLALTLRTLIIRQLPKVVRLPKGMQHLTALQYLTCDNLEELPEWIGCLSSLQRLEIESCQRIKSLPEEMRHLKCLTKLSLWNCSRELEERCQEPNGADWPKIQHIRHILVLAAII